MNEFGKRNQDYVFTFVNKKARVHENAVESWRNALDRSSCLREEPYKRAKYGSSFSHIPEDVFFKICTYLSLKDIWRLGRVCSRWYRLTRSEVLWERADVTSMNLSPKESQRLLMNLPPCVKELRIGSCVHISKQILNVPTLFHTLLERFPQLNILIIENALLLRAYSKFNLMNGFMLNCAVPWRLQNRKYYSVVKYQSKDMEKDFNALVCLLQNITVLSLRSSILAIEDLFHSGNVQVTPSRIRIMDLTRSPCATDLTIKSFCRLPLLEELYLSGTAITVNGVSVILSEVHKLKVLDLDDTVVGGETFAILRERGQSLVEVCLGRTAVRDCDLIDIDEGNFPVLKKICLVCTPVSEIGIKKLLLSVPSLMYILVTKSAVKVTWVLDQPAYVREKVKYDDCDESEECNHFLKNKFQGEF